MNFKTIGNIDIYDESSWRDAVFVTIDVDWASDSVLAYLLDLIETADLPCTIFITHETSLISRMRDMNNIELGIHPNFNPLLTGDNRYGKTVYEIVDYYKRIVPEAISARSHSITQGSLIYDAFIKAGIQFDCNTFIPAHSNIELKPWKEDFELYKIPHFWADDFQISLNQQFNIETYLNANGLKVFDFHPIHIFLNSERMERYNKSRPFLQDYKKLKGFINADSYGIGDFFRELIDGRNMD